MNRRWSLVCLLVSALAAVAPAIGQVPKPGEDKLMFMADEAPMMRKAVLRAQSELDEFFRLAASPPETKDGFSLKVGLPLGGDEREYVWITDFKKLDDGRYVGVINNDVQLTEAFKLGDQYVFSRSQIIDWMYVDNAEEKMYGNYSLCALLSEQPGEDAARLLEYYQLDCKL
jgi:uncharacterized protein YegJ (DUF2314 family)